MKKMTVGELIDELSGYDRSQRVSVYFKGIDLTPYKIVEHADEAEVAIYATPLIGDPCVHHAAMALRMISHLEKTGYHLRPREWVEEMANSINDEIGLPMVEVVMVDGYPRVGLIHGMEKSINDRPKDTKSAPPLSGEREDWFFPDTP